MVTLAQGLPAGLAELSLELECGLRYFYPSFLPLSFMGCQTYLLALPAAPAPLHVLLQMLPPITFLHV